MGFAEILSLLYRQIIISFCFSWFQTPDIAMLLDKLPHISVLSLSCHSFEDRVNLERDTRWEGYGYDKESSPPSFFLCCHWRRKIWKERKDLGCRFIQREMGLEGMNQRHDVCQWKKLGSIKHSEYSGTSWNPKLCHYLPNHIVPNLYFGFQILGLVILLMCFCCCCFFKRAIMFT